MLSSVLDELEQARVERRAIAAFSTYTLESTVAICSAAERLELPVILQIGSGAARATSLPALAAACLAAASESSQVVGLHLDHSRSLEEIRICIDLGFTSVMIDGSGLGLEENVALTARAVELAHGAGVWIEGEIGAVGGDEHASGRGASSARTEPGDARRFVEATGVDVLAAAVGTVHGYSAEPVHVELARLRAIVAATDIPFALHGASGIDDDELAAAIAAGAAKVNVNAELRRAFFAGLRRGLERGDDDVVALQSGVVEALESVAADRLELFARRGPRHVQEEGGT